MSLIIKNTNIKQSGMSLVEVLLAVAIFAVLSIGIIGAIIYGQESTAVAGARERAVKIAEEGIEAVRNIRDSGYSNLPTDGTYGLAISGNIWTLSGASDVTDIFTRSITLSTIDPRTRGVTVNVTWSQTIQRPGSVSLNAYLTDWVSSPGRRGMLVYGDGDSISDAIKYQIYDDNTGTWSSANPTLDVDVATSNKYLRVAKVYASSTRDEKVLITRHYNGTGQWIYAQVYNGTTSSWGNLVQLSTWNATTFLDVRNFDATYMVNGDLMVVYSDNTTTPKYRIWNGTSWSAQASLTSLGGGRIPSYVVLKSRPATNEVMMATSSQNSDTISEYYFGGTWSATTIHANAATLPTARMVDFSWSSLDTTKGALVYTDNANDKRMNIRIWTANSLGSGTWGITAQYGTAQANNIGALSIFAVKGTNNFNACDKDLLNPPRIICMRANTTGWVASSDIIVAMTTDNGIQPSYDLGFEQSLVTYGVLAYSDGTTIAQLKKFNTSTNVWDAIGTSLNSLPVGLIKTVRVKPNPISDDMLIFVTDSNLDLYSVGWNGATHSLFTTPAGKAWLAHGVNGSNITDYWYDFAWDGL